MDRQELAITDIRIDGGTQPRGEIDMFVVTDYAEAWGRDAPFPPVEVVFDGKDYWLWDGFHRYHGARKAGRETIEANVRNGTVEEARWLCLSANKSHGLRRTNEEKRKAVEAALRMRPEMSDRAIAEHCGVSHQTVANIRRESLSKVDSQPTPRVGKDGRTINTSNIGKRSEPRAPEPTLFSEEDETDEPSPPDTPPAPQSAPPQSAPSTFMVVPLVAPAPSSPRSATSSPPATPVPQPVAPLPLPLPVPARPSYPHSDRLTRWNTAVWGEAHYIDLQLGGILGMLAEPEKWNWAEVETFLLPQLRGFQAKLAEFIREIENASHGRTV